MNIRRPDRGIRLARDSPLEESGFEPSVPLLVLLASSRNDQVGHVLSSGPVARGRSLRAPFPRPFCSRRGGRVQIALLPGANARQCASPAFPPPPVPPTWGGPPWTPAQ